MPGRLLFLLVCHLALAQVAGPTGRIDPSLRPASGGVNGFVRDSETGEPLPYANVYLEAARRIGPSSMTPDSGIGSLDTMRVGSTGLGSATNDRGYYYIGRVPPGEYALVFSYVGYSTERRRIRVSEGRTLTADAGLKPGSVKVEEVVVSAERARFEREVEVSATRLETRQLAIAPRVGGEIDLFRAVQLLPGVISTSDFSNKLYIRGGSPDQNLILLDGITVYNPSHLFGLFSPFVPEAVSKVDLLAGGFPAQYGGRLSSVLDVTTKEGNSKHYTGKASASVIAAKAIAEGPIPNGSFLVAGRRTYLPDLILAAFDVEGLGYYFYDLMGKVNYALNPDYRLTLSGLGAEDVLDFWDPDNPEDLSARLNWGNRGVSLRASAIASPVLYGEVLAAWSNFFSGFRVAFGPSDTAYLQTDLTDLTLKSDFTWYLADRHTASFGADVKHARMKMAVNVDTLAFEERDAHWPPAVYADDRWELLPDRLFLRPGLRYSFYSKGDRHELEPRLGVKYKPGPNTALNGSAGRFTQPVVTLNSTETVFSIYDVWLPVPLDRNPPSATHWVAGVEHWLRDDATLEFELYYKDYSSLLETRYGQPFTRPESLLDASGYSYGADFSLRRTEGWVNGWLSYSFAWTRRQLKPAAPDTDELYHPHYDRRHNLNLVVNLPALFWGVDLSTRFTVGTGLPYAGAVGYYPRYKYVPSQNEIWRSWELIEGPRDAFRYPLYHRLDAGLVKTWALGWAEVSAFLDVTNLYNAQNVLLYYWAVGAGDPPERRKVSMIPILPTVGIEVKF